MSLIDPHGGKLVNRVLEVAAAKTAASEASGYKSVTLSPREAFDLEMIAIGALLSSDGVLWAKPISHRSAKICGWPTAPYGRFPSRSVRRMT